MDARFLIYLVKILVGFACLGSSRYDSSSIFGSALLMYKCGVRFPELEIGGHCEGTSLINPSRTILGVGFHQGADENVG